MQFPPQVNRPSQELIQGKSLVKSSSHKLATHGCPWLTLSVDFELKFDEQNISGFFYDPAAKFGKVLRTVAL